MRLLHEPLLHFLLIGALLFGADAARRNNDAPAPQVIEITAAEVARLQAWWSKQKGRAVTAEELRGLIKGHVREEVLYREALAMGLDKDDSIVRRRLAQKLEFLIVDAAVPQQHDEPSLRSWFDTNRQRYMEAARLSFSQVYFNPDRRGPAVEPDARAVLAALESSEPPASAALRGDRFLPGHAYRGRSQAEIAGDFGAGFASALIGLEVGRWRGPIASGYGLHLVRVEERTTPRQPVFEEVRAAVARDELAERRAAADAAAYRQLRKRYLVIVDESALETLGRVRLGALSPGPQVEVTQ
jgi:peptidyl-prolyl cis-trans isomerase C